MPSNLVIVYYRLTGLQTLTLGELASMPSDESVESFHFVLNNQVIKDNRIPPYGMSYEVARKRNALPVPATQFGNPAPTGTYQHWDEVMLNPPINAVTAKVSLMYQSTSWEYIQFLALANKGANAFLVNEGRNLLDAWIGTGMSPPVTMASTNWGTPFVPMVRRPGSPTNLTATGQRKAIALAWVKSPVKPVPTGFRIYADQAGKSVLVSSVGPNTVSTTISGLTSKVSYTHFVAAWLDKIGDGTFEAGTDVESEPSNLATATTQ